MESEKKEFWCIISLLGHNTLAGHLSEYTMAGASFLKLDVPETDKHPAYTKLFKDSSVYSIDPVDEQTARYQAGKINVAPLSVWEADTMLSKQLQKHGKTIVNIQDLPAGFLDGPNPIQQFTDNVIDDTPFNL